MSAFRMFLARLAGSYGRIAAKRRARFLHPCAFDHASVFRPMLSMHAEAAALHDAYLQWRRANGLDRRPSVLRTHLRSQSTFARLLDHLSNDPGAVPGHNEGSFFIGALQRRLAGKNEGSARPLNRVMNGAHHGIDHAGVIGVFGEAGCQVDNGVGQDHGRRLFGNQFGLGVTVRSVHVILRGFFARIRAVLRGRVE